MQTFLPYPDERASAAVLDDQRLGKQRVETLQVLRALTWRSYGWANHPAVRMWRGFVPALVHYGVAVCDEWVARGRADAVRAALLDFTGGVLPSPQQLHDLGQRPPWLGLEALHRSHRSALVRKDPERYRPFFPDVPDDLPYLWPAAAFPRWPVRRGGTDPLPLAEALAVLGLDGSDGLPPGGRDAVERLRAGRSAVVRGADPEALRAVGLIAGLTTRGPTVWVVPGEEPPVPGQAPDAPDVPLSGSVVSASVARAPEPEDLASVAAEVAGAAAPDFRFLRVSQLGGDAVAEVGAVVLDAHLGGAAAEVLTVSGVRDVPTLTLTVDPAR